MASWDGDASEEAAVNTSEDSGDFVEDLYMAKNVPVVFDVERANFGH